MTPLGLIVPRGGRGAARGADLQLRGESAPEQVDDLAVQRTLFAFGPGYQLGVQVGGQAQEQADDGFGHDGSIYHDDTSWVLWYHSSTGMV